MVCGLPCCSKLTGPLTSDYGWDPGGLHEVGFIKVINVGRVQRSRLRSVLVYTDGGVFNRPGLKLQIKGALM